MKLSREIVAGVLGTPPQDKEGKKCRGVEYRSPQEGEVFFNISTWHTAASDYSGTKHPVAIFEDTHRPDGTPMDIVQMREVNGYRAEFFGKGMRNKHMGDADGYIFFLLFG